MISALYVRTNGPYFGLPDVDPWDEARDARLYRGPRPVVAHPPEAIARHGLAYCKRAGELAFKGGGSNSAVRIDTPPAFKQVLIDIARGAA